MLKKTIDLPEELIIEILLRLPVKTLIRCKCVCKSWLSLVSHPDFATSHFQLATNRLVCLGKYSKTLSIDFNASLNNDSSYAPLRNENLPRRVCPEIGGSCRGFIFFHIWAHFYLWNPSTGVQEKIPASPVTLVSNTYLYTFLNGFGYDHLTDDYFIVLGSCDCRASYSPASRPIDLEIFSLRANKWKQIEDCSHFPYITSANCEDGGRVGSFFNGAIYWLVRNHETSNDVIIAFDLKEMTMSEISLPCGFGAIDYPYNCGLSVLGRLIAAWSVEMLTIKIWTMQNYAVHSSWTKTLIFPMHPAPYFSPICFTNCGDIIGTDGGGGLMKFNDKGQLLEHHSYSDGNCYFNKSQMGIYTESMLSLPSDTEDD